MNRGAGSPWTQMERDICAYRSENPSSRIEVSVTERLVPDKEGDRPISRRVTITDQNGKTPEALKQWTDEGNLVYMNPKSKNRG